MVPISYFEQQVKYHEKQLKALLKTSNLEYKDVLAFMFKQEYNKIHPEIYKEILLLSVIKKVLNDYAESTAPTTIIQEDPELPPEAA